jgi:predicted peptidase
VLCSIGATGTLATENAPEARMHTNYSKAALCAMTLLVLLAAMNAAAQDNTPQAASPGATGDQQRHYYFAEAGQELPYRLYVPEGYDPARPIPLIVALHGFGGDQDYFFNSVSELPSLLERHGFAFVAPMGLAEDGWYGAPLHVPGAAPRSGGGPPPTPERTPEEETHYRALSEQDVLNVLDLVKQEYNIDPQRTYLMGHSMGGFGTWWIGQKYAETWTAIAPLSGVLPGIDYQLPRLQDVAVHVSIGGAENPAWVQASRQQVETLKAMGIDTGYFEPEGESHGSMIAPTVPQVLEFFSRQRRD